MFVVEKVVDEWLGWLFVNHITSDQAYIDLKTQQTKLIMLKAIGKVNPDLLQSESLMNYFDGICKRSTTEIIKGVLSHACHGCVVGIEEKRQDFRNGFPGAFLITPFSSPVRSPFRKEWIFYLVLSPDAPHRRSGSRLQSCSSQNRCL